MFPLGTIVFIENFLRFVMSNGKEAEWPGNENPVADNSEEHGRNAGISTLDFTGCGTVRPTSIEIEEKKLTCKLSGAEAMKLASNIMAIAMNPDVDFEDPEAITLTVRESKMELLSATILGRLYERRTDEDKRKIQAVQRAKQSIRRDISQRVGADA